MVVTAEWIGGGAILGLVGLCYKMSRGVINREVCDERHKRIDENIQRIDENVKEILTRLQPHDDK